MIAVFFSHSSLLKNKCNMSTCLGENILRTLEEATLSGGGEKNDIVPSFLFCELKAMGLLYAVN